MHLQTLLMAGCCPGSMRQCGAAEHAGHDGLRAWTDGAMALTADCAHNPEVVGSNPTPATKKLQVRGLIAGRRSGLLDRLSVVCPRDQAAPGMKDRGRWACNGRIDRGPAR